MPEGQAQSVALRIANYGHIMAHSKSSIGCDQEEHHGMRAGGSRVT